MKISLINRRIIALVSAVFFVSSCGEKPQIKLQPNDLPWMNYDASLSQCANIEIPESESSLLDIFDKIEIIPLKNEDCLIGNIDDIGIYDDNIVIIDKNIAQKIVVFDTDGRFLRQIGTKGKSKGEYMSISYSEISHDYIQIVDWQLGKYLRYDIDGNLLEDRLIRDDIPCQVVYKGDSYYINYDSSINDREYCISMADSLWMPLSCSFLNQYPGLGRLSSMSSFDSREIMYSYNQCDTVYAITDSYVYPKYIFPIHCYDTDRYLEEILHLPQAKRLKELNSLSDSHVADGPFFESSSLCSKTFRKGDESFMLLYDKPSKSSSLIRLFKLNRNSFPSLYFPGFCVGISRQDIITSLDAGMYRCLDENVQKDFWTLLAKEDSQSIMCHINDDNNNPVICLLHVRERY